jgi:hypothetical protein
MSGCINAALLIVLPSDHAQPGASRATANCFKAQQSAFDLAARSVLCLSLIFSENRYPLFGIMR